MKLIAVLAVVLLAASSAAAPAPALASFTTAQATLAGPVSWTGGLAGLKLAQPATGVPGSTFTASGAQVMAYATNYTALQEGGLVSAAAHRSRANTTLDGLTLAGGSARAGAEVVAVPLDGAPQVEVVADAVTATPSTGGEVRETAFVDSTRPVLAASVDGALRFHASQVRSIRLTGTFALSLWGWNFTAQDARPLAFMTGTTDAPVQESAPTWAASRHTEQVVQLFVQQGWVEFSGLQPTTWDAYLRDATAVGTGEATFAGVTGHLGAGRGVDADHATLHLLGGYATDWTPGAGAVTVALRQSTGASLLDGEPIDLHPAPGPLPAVAAVVAGDAGWSGTGLLALLLVPAAAAWLGRVPYQRHRFRRLLARFDRHEYERVLRAIGPFTRRPRFARRATFVKAVSLLSLRQFREAGLYLATLGGEGPDAATKAFLNACASAGQGDTPAALDHLGACLRLDPTYIEEARAIPLLGGLVPYFALDAEEP